MAEIHESKMQRRVRHEIRSPRAAAFAGIAYAITNYYASGALHVQASGTCRQTAFAISP